MSKLGYKLSETQLSFEFWEAKNAHQWEYVVWTTLSYDDFDNMFCGFPMKGEI